VKVKLRFKESYRLSKEQVCCACCLFHARLSFGLFFNLEDGGDMILRMIT
jgi:hypothetical protein